MNRIVSVARWLTLWLLTLAGFGTWLLPWEQWTNVQRDSWIAAVIVCGFTLIFSDRRP